MQQQWLHIQPQLKQACNPIRSQNFGRYVFKINMLNQLYWLKIQKLGVSPEHEQSFQQEISNYLNISALASEILVPFNIISLHSFFPFNEKYAQQGMLLEHAPALFATPVHNLTPTEIFQCLNLSLDVVAKLHEISFIHGDLKAEHFRKIQHRAVLIDFEQAFQQLSINSSQHNATPRYMAPELFHAQPKSFASDVYALGIIWLEWLTQERLQAKSYLDWAKLHCQQLKVELPMQFKAFEAVLLALLCKEKQQRCINFYQIKQQLSEIEQRKSRE